MRFIRHSGVSRSSGGGMNIERRSASVRGGGGTRNRCVIYWSEISHQFISNISPILRATFKCFVLLCRPAVSGLALSGPHTLRRCLELFSSSCCVKGLLDFFILFFFISPPKKCVCYFFIFLKFLDKSHFFWRDIFFSQIEHLKFS